MTLLENRNYFTDFDVLKDPYGFFDALRAKGSIWRQPNSGIVFVTGFDEALSVLKNAADFSSVNCVGGAGTPLPFDPNGPDIFDQLEENRSKFLGSHMVVTYDDRAHLNSRALLSRLFTPSRLKANAAYITELSDELVGKAVAKGGCEMIHEIAVPFVTLVIADLLGVPQEDRQYFMDTIAAGPAPGSLTGDDKLETPLDFMIRFFVDYVEERRKNPKPDVMTELATATYPDGGLPSSTEIATLATFLFGAGQDTSAKLLGNAVKFLVDEPGLQARVRADHSLIPAFFEEVLRLEGSTKMTSRIARRDTQIGDYKVPAGTQVMIALAAANRDAKRWEDPNAFKLQRVRPLEHVGFGRGAHVCIGAPLARAELKIVMEKLLTHTSHIDLDDAKHGPRGARDIEYEASFIVRGFEEMYLKLTPA